MRRIGDRRVEEEVPAHAQVPRQDQIGLTHTSTGTDRRRPESHLGGDKNGTCADAVEK